MKARARSRRWFLVIALSAMMMTAVGCEATTVRAEPTGEREQREPPQPTEALSPNTPVAEFEAPAIDLEAHHTRIDALKILSVAADTRLVVGDHLYIGLPLSPSEVAHSLHPDPTPLRRDITRVVIPGLDRHVTGVYLPEDARLRLRVEGAEALPERFEVVVVMNASERIQSGRPAQAIRLQVTGAASAAPDDGLEAMFFSAASRWSSAQSRGDQATAFYEYAGQRLSLLGASNGRLSRSTTQPAAPGTDAKDLMNLYTGMASIDGALASDRGLLVRAEGSHARNQIVSVMKGVAIPNHPWARMINELEGPPVIEAIAGLVPHDMLYLRFHDPREMLQILGELDQQFSALGMATEASAGSARIVERYAGQLILDPDVIARALGPDAMEDVAITLSDPFLREGTDLSVIFYRPDHALLDRTLEGLVEEARKTRADLTSSTLEIEGFDVERLATPDRIHQRFRVRLDDALVLSNSLAAITRILKVRRGREKALSLAEDFAYMRALYPMDDERESAFVFISDAFVRRITGPEIKILQARRAEATADLKAVGFAAMLYAWLEGHPPADASALVTSGLILERELQHFDGAAIILDPTYGARSEAWGRVGMMRPLAEHEIHLATSAEGAAYREFVTDYERQWSVFVDPIGVRIERIDDGGGYKLDARMLPLIAVNEYRDIIRVAGDQTYRYNPSTPGIQLTFAIGDLFLNEPPFNEHLRGFGNNFFAGFLDQKGMWERVKADLQAGHDPFDPFDSNALFKSSFYLGFHVKDQLTMEDSFRIVDRTFSRGYMDWAFASTSHRSVPIVEFTAKLPEIKSIVGDGVPFAHACFVNGDVFLLAFQREVLETLIDHAIDGHMPEVSPPGSSWENIAQAGFDLLTASADSDLGKIVTAAAEKNAGEGCLSALLAYDALTWSGEAVTPRRAMDFLGLDPQCSRGGALTIDPLGLPYNTQSGGVFMPPADVAPTASEIAEAIAAIERFSAHVSIEGEDEHQGLHVQVSWTRRRP